MAAMRDRNGCFRKSEVKRTEIVGKNMKSKSNKLLEVREGRHNINNDFKLWRRQIVALDVLANKACVNTFLK